MEKASTFNSRVYLNNSINNFNNLEDCVDYALDYIYNKYNKVPALEDLYIEENKLLTQSSLTAADEMYLDVVSKAYRHFKAVGQQVYLVLWKQQRNIKWYM